MQKQGINIYLRKDGPREGRLIEERIPGKPYCGYEFGKTCEEAERKLGAASSKNTGFVHGSDGSFAVLANEWLHLKAPQLKAPSIAKYTNLLNLYLLPIYGDKQISSISRSDVTQWSRELLTSGGAKAEGLAPKTVNSILSLMRSILEFASREKGISTADTKNISVKQPQKPMRILSRVEQQRLSRYLRTHLTPCNMGILLCLYTGLRIGEICALTWADILIEEQCLYIHQTMQRIQVKGSPEKKTTVVILSPKSECSVRRIPVPDEIGQLLRMLQKPDDAYLLTGMAHSYTATTSLCDEDVADSFRSCVINLDEKPVVACFLGCDGVEDAYRDTYEELGGSHVLMGGVHTFFKDLICKLASMDQVAFESYLRDMLPDFSANGKFSRSGSGDDVSVAGIVDMDSIKSLVHGFEYDVKRYSLEEDLFWKEDELRGKTRKHGILRKRMDEALSAFEELQSKLSQVEDELQQQRVQREKYAQCVEQAKADLEAYRQESELATEQFDGRYSRFAVAVQRFFDEISTGYSQKEAAYRKMLERLLDFDKKIEALDADRVQLSASVSELSNKYTDAKNTFEEYDAKYQEIANEKAKIECEIDSLKGTG